MAIHIRKLIYRNMSKCDIQLKYKINVNLYTFNEKKKRFEMLQTYAFL